VVHRPISHPASRIPLEPYSPLAEELDSALRHHTIIFDSHPELPEL